MGSNRLAMACWTPGTWTVLLIMAAPAVTALVYTLKSDPVPPADVAPVCTAPVCTVDISEFSELSPLGHRSNYVVPAHPRGATWLRRTDGKNASNDDLRIDVRGKHVTIANTSDRTLYVETVSGDLMLGAGGKDSRRRVEADRTNALGLVRQ